MKTQKKALLILFIALFAISCNKKKEEAPAPIPAANYFLKAKIDGVAYNAEGIRVIASQSANRLTIGSVIPDGKNFEFVLDNPSITVRSYSTRDDFSGLRMSFNDGSAATVVYDTNRCDGRGIFTITALSATEVAGTFSFRGKRTGGCTLPAKEITEGEFKCGIIQ